MIERQTLTREEAAKFLGLSTWLLWKLTKAGEIPFINAGRRVLYRKETLQSWLQEREHHIAQ